MSRSVGSIGLHWVWLVVGCILVLPICDGFSSRIIERTDRGRLSVIKDWKLFSSTTSTEEEEDVSSSSLDIVLFGMGDYRTEDHDGLIQAVTNNNNNNNWVMPLTILESHSLQHIPMARTHTTDTSSMLHSALTSLETELQTKLSLPLHCMIADNNDNDCDGSVVWTALNQVLSQVQTIHPTITDVTVHVCDLGPIDNDLQYGPYAQLFHHNKNNNNNDDNNNTNRITIQPWNCNLRSEPWKDVQTNVDSFVDSYPDYTQKYQTKPQKNASSWTGSSTKKPKCLTLESLCQNIPSKTELHSMICQSLQVEETKVDYNSGLYATHWGGMNIPQTMTEAQIQNLLQVYCHEAHSDDETLMKLLPWWNTKNKDDKEENDDDDDQWLKINPTSLEHASIQWMMTDTTDASGKKATAKNLLPGELVTRFLAAPLLYGMVSPRQLWHMAEETKAPPVTFFPPTPPLQSLVETTEWHRLLAAKQILEQQQKTQSNHGELQYGYWRWHGYLCRYAQSSLHDQKDNTEPTTGLVLVHGFGASGSQFGETIEELSSSPLNGEDVGNNLPNEVLAPDLIGFGHCEKPPITYTQYMWSAFVSDFIANQQQVSNWDSYYIGGNSIGGYTSMMTAADDDPTTSGKGWPLFTSSGKVGNGKCQGLILMNSAGRILNQEEVDQAIKSSPSSTVMSIAEATIFNQLGPCKPPPGWLAKVGGNGLLGYLRPRIQSICQNLYPTNPAAVDDELCGGILRDSLDPGAINVMISGSKLPPPRTANELLRATFGAPKHPMEGVFTGPVLVAQGMLDPLNDARGRASLLESLRQDITVHPINGGHCPHDELPKDMATAVANWINQQQKQKKQFEQEQEQEQPEPQQQSSSSS